MFPLRSSIARVLPNGSLTKLCLRQLNKSSKLNLNKNKNFDSFNEVFIHKTLLSSIKQHNDTDYVRCSIFNSNGDMIQHGKEILKSQFIKRYNLTPRDFRKFNWQRSATGTTTASSSSASSSAGESSSAGTKKSSGSSSSSSSLHPSTSALSLSNSSLGSSSNVDIVPNITIRRNSILVQLLNIRALINHDKLIIFDNSSSFQNSQVSSYTHSQFLKDLSQRLKSTNLDGLPFEFKALEGILIYIVSNLNMEMKVHNTVLQNIITGLEDSIDRNKLRYLLIESKKIHQFHRKITLIKNCLEDLLENDDELNDLYITEKFQNNSNGTNDGQPRQGTNHEEIEMLLENYYQTIDEIVQIVENLKNQIKTTEDLINVVLDSNRNQLMLLGLKFSTGLLSMGVALYVSALYGMNLENFIEEIDGGFEVVTVVSTIALIALLLFSVKQLKKVEKVTMTSLNDQRK
ncbi:inner membrane magnesium transporter, mitochondrial precursor, putative [Candida dubliniensis CD36]|uniref:Magnesium transporter n=1 Tax=Candida dubliniensis (strain CD36 / ATCC MYA-646 / CBS 7987 / NCPF 3949 / NRRL Y-17841) TaxID=573826 RepID=B9WIS8_CANDC|nr:inner membrane magnesium transporter, mitochondrial precursor, putative [Candida dubliniensis CD36]CAX41146.1 inner membrane magnesium transporter, mitochondrial precursor, putative [Candida dubliniensis CD36]